MYKLVVALIIMAGLQIVRVASFNLNIRPEYVHVSDAAQTVSFTCSAGVALAGCQVRWWDRDTKAAGPLLELSRGSQSQADPAHLDSKLTGYSYSGRGLGAGDCGASLQVVGNKFWMVACRVRTESGGWKYAWSDLTAHSADSFNHTITPRETVVLPGGEARYMLKAGEPLSQCVFWLPSTTDMLYFSEGAGSNHSTGQHLYLGAGLQSGECGLTLTNISEADNGPIMGVFWSTTNEFDHRFTALVVTRRPTAPTLGLVYTGDNVTATCEVQESRPVANMSWVLGDAVILKDVITHATAQDEWMWPWTTGSIKQTLTLQLQPQHNGAVLKCVVSHVTLAQSLEERISIAFTVPTTMTTASTTANTTASTVPGPNCLATNYLDLYCREYRVLPSQHGNTSCPKDEVHEYRIREAEAAAKTAEIEEETAKTKLEAAKSNAKAEESRAKAEEFRATHSQLEVKTAKTKLEASKSSAELEEETAKMKLESTKFSARAEESRAKAEESRAKAEESRATASQLEEETAKTKLEAAKLEVDAAEFHVRAEDSRAQNAGEELQFERERRTKSLQHSQSPQSQQG